jgi:hypothetical protein
LDKTFFQNSYLNLYHLLYGIVKILMSFLREGEEREREEREPPRIHK